VVSLQPIPGGTGYWMATAAGEVASFGAAHPYGSMAGTHLNQPVVAMAATPDARGYWLVASDGGIFSFGGAHFFGSTGSIRLNQPIVAMASTPDAKGYWMLAADGGIFTYGDAHFFGSMGGRSLTAPIVAMATTPDGQGYWLVGSDGSVFAFGDASYVGSGPAANSQPVDSIVSATDGRGYWLVANDGSLQAFGSAAGAASPSLASGSSSTAVGGVVQQPPSAGRAALAFALSQQGKAYVWGGSGPNGYDCSGLTLRSWQAAGITLPRTAADQYNAGTHVPLADLQPGDLVFYAGNPGDPRTIYHVAIYVGGGQVIAALHPGTVVETMSINYVSGLLPLGTRP
jgi:cell wall-associated NlpC family hydrolase